MLNRHICWQTNLLNRHICWPTKIRETIHFLLKYDLVSPVISRNMFHGQRSPLGACLRCWRPIDFLPGRAFCIPCEKQAIGCCHCPYCVTNSGALCYLCGNGGPGQCGCAARIDSTSPYTKKKNDAKKRKVRFGPEVAPKEEPDRLKPFPFLEEADKKAKFGGQIDKDYVKLLEAGKEKTLDLGDQIDAVTNLEAYTKLVDDKQKELPIPKLERSSTIDLTIDISELYKTKEEQKDFIATIGKEIVESVKALYELAVPKSLR